MADEIEALVERVEADNAALEARLEARRRELELAAARAEEECAALRRRLAALEPELRFTQEYVDALKLNRMSPSPQRARRQLVQLGIRVALCAAAAGGGVLLHVAELPDLVVGLCVAVPGLSVWILGDRCDALEVRHG